MKKFVDELKRGTAVSLWDLSKINFKMNKLILFGGSFSGAICCGLATLTKFDKIVLFSPVLDYSRLNEMGDEQNPKDIIPFVKRAYENLFRIEFDNLVTKMLEFKECSPKYYLNKLKIPILILHDPDDKTVSIRIPKEFSKSNPNIIRLIEHRKGHEMDIALQSEWKTIEAFING